MRVGEIEITKVIFFYTFYFHKKTWKLEKITQNENSHEWSISPEVRALWRVGEKSVINGNLFFDTLEFTKKSLIFVSFISSVKTCFFLKFHSFLVKKVFFETRSNGVLENLIKSLNISVYLWTIVKAEKTKTTGLDTKTYRKCFCRWDSSRFFKEKLEKMWKNVLFCTPWVKA